MARVDAEYHVYLHQVADGALEQAKGQIDEGIEATFLRHDARSAATGLIEIAESHQARAIVVGSSSAGVFGHVVLGSVTERLLHSSPVSVAIAPRGYRCPAGQRLTRVNVAYGGDGAETMVAAATALAAEVGASFRVVSFAVWARPAYTTRLGTDPEDAVLKEWTSTVESDINNVLDDVGAMSNASTKLEIVIGRGRDWGQAIDDVGWGEGDVLVVGSSTGGPFAQIFLGSRAAKILRHSPVPVVVVPRARAEQLADASDHQT